MRLLVLYACLAAIQRPKGGSAYAAAGGAAASSTTTLTRAVATSATASVASGSSAFGSGFTSGVVAASASASTRPSQTSVRLPRAVRISSKHQATASSAQTTGQTVKGSVWWEDGTPVQHSVSLTSRRDCVGKLDNDQRQQQHSQADEVPPDHANSYDRPGLLDDFDRLGGLVKNQVRWEYYFSSSTISTGLAAWSRIKCVGNTVPVEMREGHRWLLLRHGQTDFNADGRVQGSSDIARLSDEGRRQAAAVGAFLATSRIDKIYVSPLARAQETLDEADKAIAALCRPYNEDSGLSTALVPPHVLPLTEELRAGSTSLKTGGGPGVGTQRLAGEMAGWATLGLAGNRTQILQVVSMTLSFES